MQSQTKTAIIVVEVCILVHRCPSDPQETAEALYMGRLNPAQARRFQAHMKSCSACRQIHAEAAAFVKSMRQAARRIRQTEAAASPRVHSLTRKRPLIHRPAL
ncbi:MAG: zf-HC2 domain-containing protein [Acidobacteriia bacterium]|nr:zf-HC2 domain-containing protein [Terriglobia bacterium]